ncbi:YadA family autotransporter adhesin [Variovorax sp. W6]|uniref:YadA family autotransporter adhesin n=1 Tax=Variovorax sp. W6 TaxID=3093895 RepID=UPI003D809406
MNGTREMPVDGSSTLSNVAGCNASGNNQDGVSVFGSYSQGTASGASAFGFSSTAGKWGSAVGLSSDASGTGSSAIGYGSKAPGINSTAIGAASTATGQGSVAVGSSAAAHYEGSAAIGAGSTTANSLAALQGDAAYVPSAGAAISGATPAGEVSIGSSGSERRLTNVAAGGAPTDAVNVSQLSTATASLSTSLGTTNGAIASLSTSTATGLGSLSTSLNTTNSNLRSLSTSVSTLYNTGPKYFHANSTAGDSVASGSRAVAIGPQSEASGPSALAAGNGAKAAANGAVAMGSGAHATGVNAIAIGTGALATGSQAIGVSSRAGGGGAALGDNADAGGTSLSRAQNVVKGTAIGFGAVVQQSEGVALGSGSVAATAAGVAGYLPRNAPVQHQAAVKATTGTQAAVSVGDAASSQFRQITGVAAGTTDSDATNVAQLKASEAAARASSVQYATNPDGSANYSQVVLGNGQAPGGTRISNVAPGVLPTDAVNVNQLNQVRSQVGDVARIAYSGTAMAFAMSGTYLPTLSAGEKAVGVGVGSYKGYSALALTFKALSDDGRMSWGAGVSTTGKEWGLNAGVGWKWK